MVTIIGNKGLIIKCHKCGILKESNTGVFVEWEFDSKIGNSKIIVWFHNDECKNYWIDFYKITNSKECSFSEHYGFIKMPKGDEQNQNGI